MRVYNYTLIAIGIMFILLVGGVETNSSLIIQGIGGDNPSFWKTSTLWIAVIAALVAFIATNRISAGGFSFQASRESVMAAFATAIYVVFMSDLMSIVSKVAETTCPIGASITGCGWEYWIIWAIVIPMGAGYGISLIQFIGGSD